MRAEQRENIEAKNDFIVFGKDFIVLLQVVNRKVPNCDFSFLPEKIRAKEVSQQKTALLIKNLESACWQMEQDSAKKKDLRVFRFFAYPEANEPKCVKLISSLSSSNGDQDHLCDENCIPVITEDDWYNIENWWEENIVNGKSKPCKTLRSDSRAVLHVMHAIWMVSDESRDYTGFKNLTTLKTESGSINTTTVIDSPNIERSTSFKYHLPVHLQVAIDNFENRGQKKSVEKYFEVGDKIFEAFQTKDGFAEMFPSSPKQQYIDLYSEEERSKADSSSNIVTDHQKQQDYEVEALMFRALERLQDGEITVIHGVKYTHYQYRVFCQHAPKGCNGCIKKKLHGDEGENDFVVFGPNYIVLIEVKNAFVESSEPTSIAKFVESAAKQQKKLLEIINAIATKHSQPGTFGESVELKGTSSHENQLSNSSIPFKVFQFVAFPGSTIRPGLGVESDICEYIIASDLESFESWWKQNVTEQTYQLESPVKTLIKNVRNGLLALCAVTSNQTIDASQFGLYNEIIDTDKKLRESEITFEGRRKQKTNPNITKTFEMASVEVNGAQKNIFCDVLGIKYITNEQRKAYEVESKRLIITGCTGSGKSLILFARFMRHLMTDSVSKFIFLVFNEKHLTEYEKFFKTINIEYTAVLDVSFNPKLWLRRVGIIHCSTNLDNAQNVQLKEILTSDINVYVDDAHASNIDFSSFGCACIVFDFNQSHINRDQIQPWNSVEHYQIVHLARNFRSTSCIASTLAKVSEFIESKETTQLPHLQIPSLYSVHHPVPGHLIQGPQVLIEVCHASMSATLFRDKVAPSLPVHESVKSLFTTGFFILSSDKHGFLRDIEQFLKSFQVLPTVVSANPREQNIYSTEFSACYIFYKFAGVKSDSIRLLLNAMSRARSYCYVLICPDEDDKVYSELEEFLRVFRTNKLKLYCAETEIDQKLHNVSIDISTFRKATLLKEKVNLFDLGYKQVNVSNDGFARMIPLRPSMPKFQLLSSESGVFDYEAQVAMYRAFEQIRNPNITVLQNLKFTYHQYRLWFPHNLDEFPLKSDSLSCHPEELHSNGDEHDFVVLGPDYIAIIAIKKTEAESFGTSTAIRQEKLLSVIRGISNESTQLPGLIELEEKSFRFGIGCEPDQLLSKWGDVALGQNCSIPYRVFRCVAFFNINTACSSSTDSASSLDTYKLMKIGLLNSSKGNLDFSKPCDLLNLEAWWEQNIAGNENNDYQEILHGNLYRVRNCLKAQHSTNESAQPSFRSCILQTEKSLRECKLIADNRIDKTDNKIVQSTEIIAAEVNGVNIFTNILEVFYLTAEQKNLFEKNSRHLIITGCAGSGKSLILLARLVHEILTTNNGEFFLLVFNEKKAADYKKLFAQSGIEVFDASHRLFQANLSQSRLRIYVVNQMISKELAEKEIVESLNSETIIYVDDSHASMLNINFFSFNCACIVFDVSQCNLPPEQLNSQKIPHSYHIASLKNNYRSGSNLVSNLRRLSEFIQETCPTGRSFNSVYEPHQPEHGHFIHGPQTIVDVCYEPCNIDQVSPIMSKFNTSIPRIDRDNWLSGRCFLLDASKEHFMYNLAGMLAKLVFKNTEPIIVNPLEQDIYSVEFTACEILLNFHDMDYKKLRLLYNVMSRIRLYCHIIVIYDESITSQIELQTFLEIFGEAKITHYKNAKKVEQRAGFETEASENLHSTSQSTFESSNVMNTSPVTLEQTFPSLLDNVEEKSNQDDSSDISPINVNEPENCEKTHFSELEKLLKNAQPSLADSPLFSLLEQVNIDLKSKNERLKKLEQNYYQLSQKLEKQSSDDLYSKKQSSSLSESKTIRAIHKTDIRQLELKRSQATTYQLNQSLMSLFPNITPSDYELDLKWKDPEGNLISISSEQELQHAINTPANGVLSLFIEQPEFSERSNALSGIGGCFPRFRDVDPSDATSRNFIWSLETLKPPPERPNLSATETVITARCDDCKKIVPELWFKCQTCYNFHLCKLCMAKGNHSMHQFLERWPFHMFWSDELLGNQTPGHTLAPRQNADGTVSISKDDWIKLMNEPSSK